ncbi:TniQ family protein [Pseudomonas costantinii]|uniref:TniQ family protein n=1 Tax=Pseudomonas costantinii TaxID=168469 RepID=UPI0015A35AC4|nr:TniQ family protein [Pseudomonas costantinii]NVZ21482.1 TniQ family protein [Pseudomonas costantinii]
MLNLPVKLTAYHDESLVGFLGRQATANGFSHNFLIKQCRKLTDEEVRCFCKENSSSSVWVTSVKSLSSSRASVDPMSMYCPKHCPKCLAEYGYWKYVWGLKLYNFCVEHTVQLIDTCHRCGMRLCLGAFTTFQCSLCHQDIRKNSSSIGASTSDVWFSRLLENRAMSKPPLNDSVLCQLPLSILHELFLNLGFIMSYPDGMHCRSVFLISDLCKVSRCAGEIAFGWPSSFYEYLDICKYGGNRDRWHSKVCYKKIYYVVFQKLKSQVYDFLRDEFENYLLSSWRGPLTATSTRFSHAVIQSHRWKPLKAVANSLGVAPSKLKLFMEKGLISSNSIQYECGKISTVVDLHEAKKCIENFRKAASLKDAARQFGISESRVRSLLSNDYLVGYNSNNHHSSPWVVDCESFIKKFSPIDALNNNDEYISIRKILPFYLNVEKQFLDFIDVLIKGEIQIFRCEGDLLFADYRLLIDEFRSWKKRWLIDNHTTSNLSAQEVATILNVKDNVVYGLINNGMLAHLREDNRYKVAPTSLKLFREQFVFNREIAQEFFKSPRMVSSRLIANGFRPVAGPHEQHNVCRHYVWRRTADLYKFLRLEFANRFVTI